MIDHQLPAVHRSKVIDMTKKSILEPVDLMVAAGIVAIVVGVFLVFVSTQGHFQVATSDNVPNAQPHDPVQPVLGQTIVTISVLERERAGEIKQAVTRLNQATVTAPQTNDSPHEPIKELADQAHNIRAAKAARAEFVKGRAVVNSTTRAIRNDSLTDQQREEYDHRMIHSAAETGKKIEKEFEQTEQPNLGRAIVAKTQSQMSAAHRIQEQVGGAIVRVSLVQDEYNEALETEQEQLGSLVTVAAQAQL